MGNASTILQAALAYGELGWSLVPVRGKRCVVDWKAWQAQQPSDALIRSWFSGTDATGVAVVCGAVSGLVVIDFDPRNDVTGEGSAWLSNADLPDTLTCATGRGDGGLHCYLRTPDGFVGKGKVEPAAGVEVRYEGHSVVAPPSRHPDTGKPYVWQGLDRLPTLDDVTDAPRWLLDLLGPPGSDSRPEAAPQSVEPTPTRPPDGDSGDFWLAKAVARAVGGNRNETGVWLACQLRDAGVSETETRATVLGYARRVRHLGEHPYTEAEALASVEQAYKRPRRETAESQTSKLPVVPTRGVAPGDRTNGAPSSSGVVNLADLRSFFGSVKWAWEPYVPIGHVTLVCGETGIGKSWFAAYLIAAFTGAQDLPTGARVSETGGVLLLETESFRGSYAERLGTLGVGNDDVVLPTLGEAEPTAIPDLLKHARVIEALALEHGVKAIVVDSLSGGHALDENSAEMRAVLRELSALAASVGVPVVVVHHLRKRSLYETAEVSLDRIRGSSAIAQFARSILGLSVPDRDAGTVLVEALKSSFCARPPSLGFRISESGIEFVVPPEPYRVEGVGERAVAFLRMALADGARSRVDLLALATEEGISRATFDRAKEAAGVVSVDGKWTLSQPCGA